MAGDATALIDLEETDLTVADPAEDVRGRRVVDRNGKEAGDVDGLLIDEEERRVRFLQVGSGGFLGLGKKTRLIPVNAVTRVAEDDVHVDTTLDDIAMSPAYDPDLTTLPRFGDYYDHYGLPPYWAPGYVAPVWRPR